MAISRPRFVGPYGTGDGEHDAPYYQREVKEFVNEVLSGIEVDNDETERLHGLFKSSEGWYRKMATDICKELRISSDTSSGSDIMDGLRATLAAYGVPYSLSPLDAAREETHLYRALLTKLRWLIKNAATPSRIADVLKHAFLDYALAVFHGNYQVFRVAELARLMHVVNPGSSSIISEDAAGSGQRITTQNEVLGAACSFINAWDDGHDKVWSKNEQKQKKFQELQTEIELLRKGTPEADLRDERRRRGDENEVRNRNQPRINVALDHERRY